MNFLSQISKYILVASVLLNAALVMYVVGIIPFFLYLSVVINLALLWYSGVCIIRVNDIEEDMILLMQNNEQFLENLENIHSLEMYYGDEYLQNLIDQSRDLVNNFVETQEKYFDVEVIEMEYDKEDTEEEAPAQKE